MIHIEIEVLLGVKLLHVPVNEIRGIVASGGYEECEYNIFIILVAVAQFDERAVIEI